MTDPRYYDATPHPDRLIEASRPRPEPEDDNRGHVMLGRLLLVVCCLGAALLIWAFGAAMSSRIETELRITPEAAIALMEGR